MNTIELREAILNLIKDLYNADYIGYLEVIKNEGNYTLDIGIPTYMQRTTISITADNDDDFINFISKELKSRNYMRQYIYKVIREQDERE